jgi:hypothetical protein
MSIGSSNLVEIEEIKKCGTQGAWLRPGVKQQPGTQLDKGSSSGPGFKLVSSRGAAGERRTSAVDGRNMFVCLKLQFILYMPVPFILINFCNIVCNMKAIPITSDATVL